MGFADCSSRVGKKMQGQGRPVQLTNLYPNATLEKETLVCICSVPIGMNGDLKIKKYAKKIPRDETPKRASFEECAQEA